MLRVNLSTVDDEYHKVLINKKKFKYFKTIQYFASIDSTNKYCIRECKRDKLQERSIIISNYQTDGVGRFDKSWNSNTGEDILASFIFKSECKVEEVYKATIPFSLAIYKVIKDFVPNQFKVKIKWPNDILINDRKCAGILSSFEKESNNIIIGLGCNINSNWKNSVDRCSMSEFSKIQLNRGEILMDIINKVESKSYDICKGKVNMEDWNSSAAFINQSVSVFSNNKEIKGQFLGISESGAAIIKNNNKFKHICNGRDLKLIANLHEKIA